MEGIIKAVRQHQVRDNVIFVSFDDGSLVLAKELDPGIRTEIIVLNVFGDLLKIAEDIRADGIAIAVSTFRFFKGRLRVGVERVHRAGLWVNDGVFNSIKSHPWLLAGGIDGVFTDVPALIGGVVERLLGWGGELFKKGGISALIMAAGKASRMGCPKQLLPFGSTSLLGRVVENLMASSVQEVVLVLGHEAQAVLRVLGFDLSSLPKRLKVVLNTDYREGFSSSLRCGLSSLDVQARAVLIALGDQPLIGPSLVDSLIAVFEEGFRGIVVPIYHARRGHPTILDLKYRPEMERIEGDRGCREILAAYPEDLLEVEVDAPQVIWDVDTPDEYRRCLEALEGGDERS